MPSEPLTEVDLPFPRRSGKVREVFDLGDSLLIVATDRISAFDWILSTPIPDKGRLLTKISEFWFANLDAANHLISTKLPEQIAQLPQSAALEGRSMHVKKADVVPFECVVRGYLEGSGWRDYQTSGSLCGIDLPDGLQQCQQLPELLFTPATKAEEGHDENVSFEIMQDKIGAEMATELQRRSLEIYKRGAQIAHNAGLIIADTKFEFGLLNGELILIDEVLTPDSSRFWPAADYQPGRSQSSFDKQFVREFLMSTDWDRNSPPPELPKHIVEQTRAKYVEAFERLTNETFE